LPALVFDQTNIPTAIIAMPVIVNNIAPISPSLFAVTNIGVVEYLSAVTSILW